jgi:hypothetical protein
MEVSDIPLGLTLAMLGKVVMREKGSCAHLLVEETGNIDHLLIEE